MAHTIERTVDTPTAPLRGEPTRPSLWSHLALGLVMLVSVGLNFYQLGQNGFGNLYYASGVRSMLDNLHNFFFVSFDPGGFVTIDKPPLGFWLQVLSAKVFGFTAFSVLLPQALAGVLSVALLYNLVRRRFGELAGLLSALALAISPISVVTNRNNTIDSTLALVMLVGAWAVLRAAETGRLRWLLLCAATIGLGFNIKMLEAYLVVPAYGLLYLLAAPHSWWTRIKHLVLATLLMVVLSLSWLVAVDLTPASQRPWVGSTQNNSEISLALGYNGVQRLLGQFGFGGGNHNQAPSSTNGTRTAPPSQSGAAPAQTSSTNGTSAPTSSSQNGAPGNQQSGNRPPGNGGGMFNTGTAGPLRLFSEPLASQIGWLLPAALLGMIALAWQRKPRWQKDLQQQSLLVWGGWLLTMGIFFSVAGFFHPYYLTVMAPAVAALFGIGAVTMVHDFHKLGWRGWLLPIALIATGAEQIYILSNYPTWGMWLIPIIGVLCGLGVLTLLALRLLKRDTFGALRVHLATTAVSVAILSLLIAPAIWGAIPVVEGRADGLPSAGPVQQGGFGGGPGGDNTNSDTQLIRYLEANQGSAKYLVATASSNSADSIILATNKPVMALGGFSGGDPILTTSQLATLVKNGTVRFFLLSGGGFGGPGGGQQSSITTWVKQNCTTVPTSQWKSTTTSTNAGPDGAEQLYVCKG